MNVNMSDFSKNKNGEKIVWFSQQHKYEMVDTEIVGYKESDIIERYGSVQNFIDEEREYSGNSFYEKMCEGDYSEKSDGLQPIYDLKHTTSYGDWIDKDVEEVDRFDIFDGVDRVWLSKTDNLKNVVEGIVEYPNSYSEGDWKQLGLDFGLIKEDK